MKIERIPHLRFPAVNKLGKLNIVSAKIHILMCYVIENDVFLHSEKKLIHNNTIFF